MTIKKMDSHLKNVIVIIVCIIIVVSSALYLSNFSGWKNTTNSSSTSSTTTSTATTTSTSTTPITFTTPAYARVFGLVSTTGYGTYDTVVVFTSGKERYVSPIMYGSFSEELPNPGIYNVTTEWKGLYPWQNGTIYKGQVILDWGPGSKAAQSLNIVDETPHSLIQLSGRIIFKGYTANPILVRFNATDDQTFETMAENSTYSIDLPNLMDYTVAVEWEDFAGNSRWTDAGIANVQSGPGITSQILDLYAISTITPIKNSGQAFSFIGTMFG